MSNLKTECLKKCFSLLGGFIDNPETLNNNRGTALLALDQLKKITAGSNASSYEGSLDEAPISRCVGKPRING